VDPLTRQRCLGRAARRDADEDDDEDKDEKAEKAIKAMGNENDYDYE
jgi:hypothetical protein